MIPEIDMIYFIVNPVTQRIEATDVDGVVAEERAKDTKCLVLGVPVTYVFDGRDET